MVVTADTTTEEFLSLPGHFDAKDQEAIGRALGIAREAHRGQQRADGTSYIHHPIAVAKILIDWGADCETVIAGLLHDALEDRSTLASAIRATFGSTTFALIEGVTKFNEADFAGSESLDHKIETLRKLFDVMRSDIRVAVVKLADRLHNIRTLEGLPEDRRKRFARETLDVYYKIAYHLGMNDVRREFSEQCFPLLYPEEAAALRERRREENISFGNALKESEEELRKHDSGNTLFSLRKEHRSFVSLHEHLVRQREKMPAFSIVAIGRDRDACYTLLRIIHTLYRPLPGSFRDYIAVPTERAHQSIHTTVLGPRQHVLPVLICTEEMDAQEKRGILLTCFGGRRGVPGFSWLKRSKHLDQATKASSETFWQALQSDIFQETITVTVDGETLPIARGATALDAAYARHGHVANRTFRILVNGVETSHGTTLAGDDVLQIGLAGHPHVALSWLDDTTMQYARILIVRSLKQRDRHEKIAIGHRLVQRELDHFRKGFIGGLTKAQQALATEHFRRQSFEDVLAMVGEGVLPTRDIVFALFPEKRRSVFQTSEAAERRYPFRIRIIGGQEPEVDILPQIVTLARIHNIVLRGMRMHPKQRTRTFTLTAAGSAKNRTHFADFLASIERLREVSHVRTLPSTPQLAFLLMGMTLGFAVILLDVLFLPSYEELRYIPRFLSSILPTLPIIAANYLLLQLLRRYLVLLRTARFYIGLGFFMNIIGLALVIIRSNVVGSRNLQIFPLVAVFVLSMFYIGYHFFKTEVMFASNAPRTKPFTKKEWQVIVRRKVVGYTFRTFAVVIWGIQPLYLRYSPASAVSPLLRVFLMSVGILAVTALVKGLQSIIAFSRKHPQPKLKTPMNMELYGIMIGAAFFTYFLNASLLHTTSTNFILFNNFSPVLALLAAAVFWRHTIPYLRNPQHMFWIFLIFLAGSTGGSFILYNSINFPGAGSVRGDTFGILAMVADTLYVISQIRYMKRIPNASSFSINLYVFTALAIAMIPALLYLSLTKSSAILSLTLVPVLYSLGAGILSGIGQACNYETFRRIDGFIAFLMFNVSILITFFIEVFFLGKFSPNWVLLLGGIIIIGSTILAEIVSTRCEKQGL